MAFSMYLTPSTAIENETYSRHLSSHSLAFIFPFIDSSRGQEEEEEEMRMKASDVCVSTRSTPASL